MKKLFIFCVLMITGLVAKAQNIDKILAFEATRFVWSGIDFSHARMIGSLGFKDAKRVKDFLFNNWNQLMINESHKYDFADYYEKTLRIDNLTIATKRNETREAYNIVTDASYAFEKGQLEEIVSAYKGISAEADLGLVYVVETFDKYNEMAKIHVVFYNTNTGEIAWHRVYFENPSGFGLRNYWAGAVYRTIKQSGRDFTKEARRFKRGR